VTHEEGGVVAEDVCIAASAVGTELAFQATAAQEAAVGSAVGLESMEMARQMEGHTEAYHCCRMVVLTEAAVRVLGVLELETECDARELGSDADLFGEACCAAREVVVLAETAVAGTVLRCKADVGIARIVEVVVRVVARRSVGERPMQREFAVSQQIVVQIQAASCAAS
jgi:hypothetical protein